MKEERIKAGDKVSWSKYPKGLFHGTVLRVFGIYSSTKWAVVKRDDGKELDILIRVLKRRKE